MSGVGSYVERSTGKPQFAHGCLIMRQVLRGGPLFLVAIERKVLWAFSCGIGRLEFKPQNPSRYSLREADSFQLVDTNVVYEAKKTLPTSHNSGKRTVIPKLSPIVITPSLIPSTDTRDRHGDRRRHRANKRAPQMAVGEFDLKVQVISDVGQREDFHPVSVRKFFNYFANTSIVFSERPVSFGLCGPEHEMHGIACC